VGDLIERQCEIEHFSGSDVALVNEIDQVREKPAGRSRPAVEVTVREEQPLALELDTMRHSIALKGVLKNLKRDVPGLRKMVFQPAGPRQGQSN